EVWRFHTVRGPGEPGNETWSGDSWRTGGGGVWTTGVYDADLNLTYWGTAIPFRNGASRTGDNLYTDSVVALDADTGKLKWHSQFTPHDNRRCSYRPPGLCACSTARLYPPGFDAPRCASTQSLWRTPSRSQYVYCRSSAR